MARAAGLDGLSDTMSGWGSPRSHGQPHVAQGISQPDAASRRDRPRDAADALIQRPSPRGRFVNPIAFAARVIDDFLPVAGALLLG
jgi:hypothetical protein